MGRTKRFTGEKKTLALERAAFENYIEDCQGNLRTVNCMIELGVIETGILSGSIDRMKAVEEYHGIGSGD